MYRQYGLTPIRQAIVDDGKIITPVTTPITVPTPPLNDGNVGHARRDSASSLAGIKPRLLAAEPIRPASNIPPKVQNTPDNAIIRCRPRPTLTPDTFAASGYRQWQNVLTEGFCLHNTQTNATRNQRVEGDVRETKLPSDKARSVREATVKTRNWRRPRQSRNRAS